MPHVKQALVGLDLNSTRARAVSVSAEVPPQMLPLDGTSEELSVFLSLERRVIEVGRVGAAICRRLPHLTVSDFLAHLGTKRQWSGNGHKVDAARATRELLERLSFAFPDALGLTMALPPYLDGRQEVLLRGAAKEAHLPLFGTVTAPLAAAMAAHGEQPWDGSAFVLDVDDHALTWTAVLGEDGQARVLGRQVRTELNLRAWKNRLLNCLADRCVRQSRRDPRDSAEADQSLYDQLDALLAMSRSGRAFEVAVRTPTWYQNLTLQAEEMTAFCAGLVRQTLDAMRTLQATAGLPGSLVVTAAAGRLPGLTAALEQAIGPRENRPVRSADWVEDGRENGRLVHCLGPEAVARAAHDLAVRIERGEVDAGPIPVVPLPPPQPVEAGLPRLNFHGQEYVLCGLSFVLGRHQACNLVFDSDMYPTVSGRHCEILFDRRQYVLRDCSKHGTLVNDQPVVEEKVLQPGDWIQLGPQGPRLRFLGQAADQKKKITMA
jgi:hypothetical protein